MGGRIQRRPQPQPRSRAAIAHPQNGVGFAHGSATLSAEAKARIRSLIPPHVQRQLDLGLVPKEKPVVQLFTSNSGSDKQNRAVALKRYEAIASFLTGLGFQKGISIWWGTTPKGEPDSPIDRVAVIAFTGADGTLPDDPRVARRFSGARLLERLTRQRLPDHAFGES